MTDTRFIPRRHESARDALDRVGAALADSGVRGELAFGLLDRLTREPEAFGREVFFLSMEDVDGTPLAFAMRTGSYPALVVGFGAYEDSVGRALAFALFEARCSGTLHGERSWSEPVAAHLATLVGGRPTLVMRAYAMEARRLVTPAHVDGLARLATPDDTELLVQWALAFDAEAIARRNPPKTRASAEAQLTHVIAAGDVLFWEVEGVPVATALVSRRTPRSACLSLVYTSPAWRGRGYARSVVHRLSRRELDAGCEWVSLFTDADNPTSNWIYAQLGYRHVGEFHGFAFG